jgi:hypothetical protein
MHGALHQQVAGVLHRLPQPDNGIMMSQVRYQFA